MSQVGVFSDNAPGTIDIVTITGNSGGAVPPDAAGNINILGSGVIDVTGNPGTNTLTITSSSGGISWSDQSGAFNASEGNGYFITATATGTLPASPVEGDTIAFNVDTTDILTIQANTGQYIRLSTTLSSAAGTLVNTAIGDAIVLIYRATGTTWHAQSALGIWGAT